MLPGPIFNVELLTSARRTRYFFIRALYALILLIALGLIYQSWTYRISGDTIDIRVMAQLSAEFFNVLAWLQLLLVVLLGPAMVAGTIATERERRTIEYLFASSLSNAEIVLGKLAARIIHVVYLVLAGVPILALMMLMGGIAPEALLALAVITLCTVLSVATMSIAVSVWSARAREAVTRAYLVLFALLVLPPLLALLLRAAPFFGAPLFFSKSVADVNEQFLAANPFWVLTAIMTTASGATQGIAFDMLWAFARNHLILSVVLATAATWGVRRTHLKQTTKAAKRRWRLSHVLRPPVGDQAMLWKEIFAEPAAARLGWVGRIAVALILLGVIGPTFYMFYATYNSPARYGRVAEEYLIYAMMMGTILACGGLLLAAARAAGSITSERERDSWTSLVSTPLEAGEIVWAKIAGSVWSLRYVMLLLLLIWGLAGVLEPGFLITVPFTFSMFLLLAFYVSALGVRFSLQCRSSLRAMAAALATAIFIGGAYFFCCLPVLIGTRAGDEAMVILAPCVPYLLCVPSVAYVSGDHFFSSREAGPAIFAFIAGTIGYLIAGIALTGSSIGSFDRLSGRTCPKMPTYYPVHPTALPANRPPETPIELATEAILLPPSTPDIL
jgi:ABC-type transport system involved in multi-copper enzyme maturation permease subunit